MGRGGGLLGCGVVKCSPSRAASHAASHAPPLAKSEEHNQPLHIMSVFNEVAAARTALPPSLPPWPPSTPLLALLVCACMPLTSDASRLAATAAGFFGGGPGTHSGSAGGGWTTLAVVAALLLGVPVAAVILYALWQHLSERFRRWHPAVREPLLGGVLSPATARPCKPVA